jgi:hypothetical protein
MREGPDTYIVRVELRGEVVGHRHRDDSRTTFGF